MADFNIGDILNSLSPEDIENIKSIASDFIGGSNPTAEKSNPQPPEKKPQTPDFSNLGSLGMPDLSQLSGLLPIFQALNSQDERLDFIEALKPLLSAEKRQKADEAMKLSAELDRLHKFEAEIEKRFLKHDRE